MADLGTTEFSKNIVRAGLWLGPERRWPILGPLVWVFNASSSTPAYREIQYHEVSEVINPAGSPAELQFIKGDSEAPRLAEAVQRSKKQAVILSSGRLSVNNIMETLGGRPAVAATIGKIVLAGAMPNGIRDLEIRQGYYRAGIRVGRYDFRAALGVFIDETNQFVVPQDKIEPKQHITISRFHEDNSSTLLF